MIKDDNSLFTTQIRWMDSGVPGQNGNRAAKRVMMALKRDSGSVLIQLQLMAVKRVQTVQRNRVCASLNDAILVSQSPLNPCWHNSSCCCIMSSQVLDKVFGYTNRFTNANLRKISSQLSFVTLKTNQSTPKKPSGKTVDPVHIQSELTGLTAVWISILNF